ncbi:hypothetical protein FA15DRAFT_760180 [Coprinopsis marcescibilis]|uniref:Uncharacterized protein n=1 Tax=Coprinopsis marcescibilis TaxID=230819 RepID=A0A5C3KHJ3_COPMA|nr:hypothetical protein FA15DRAFT_760180 [Coprinopsis marcescibilis]
MSDGSPRVNSAGIIAGGILGVITVITLALLLSCCHGRIFLKKKAVNILPVPVTTPRLRTAPDTSNRDPLPPYQGPQRGDQDIELGPVPSPPPDDISKRVGAAQAILAELEALTAVAPTGGYPPGSPQHAKIDSLRAAVATLMIPTLSPSHPPTVRVPDNSIPTTESPNPPVSTTSTPVRRETLPPSYEVATPATSSTQQIEEGVRASS